MYQISQNPREVSSRTPLPKRRVSYVLSKQTHPVHFHGVLNRFMDWWDSHKKIDNSLPPFQNSRVGVITDNSQYLDTIIALITSAKESIKIDCFYIGGKTGQKILSHLQKMAKKGVRIFYRGDQIEGLENQTEVVPTKRRMKRLSRFISRFFYTEHYRRDPFQVIGVNHNKLIIVDNQVGFVSSKNPCEGDIKNRDVSLVMKGPIVKELTLYFNKGWYFQTKETLHDQPASTTELPNSFLERMKEQSCRPIVTSHHRRNSERAILEMIQSATQTIQLHGFCLTHRDILQSLVDMVKKGRRVQVLLDSAQAYPFRATNIVAFQELLKVQKSYPHLEVRSYVHQDLQNMNKPSRKLIHQYKNHNKMLLVDQKQAIVGSTNFAHADVDHQENISIELQGGPACEQLSQLFQDDWNHHSVPLKPLGMVEKIAAQVIKFFFAF